METRLRVNEIFRSVQGESTHAGRACTLVRLTGCPLRCSYCDTTYAFHEGRWMTVGEVLAAVGDHGCNLVEVTGGEPLAQPGTLVLLTRLLEDGREVLLETSGALPIADVPAGVCRIVDFKTPDSGEELRNDWHNVEALRPVDEVKFVIGSRRDYEWARDKIREHRLAERAGHVLLSPVHGELDPKDLVAWILEDQLPARFQLQMHKHIWPPDGRRSWRGRRSRWRRRRRGRLCPRGRRGGGRRRSCSWPRGPRA
jgi:7-carboxy-7-deazaguanine synthase